MSEIFCAATARMSLSGASHLCAAPLGDHTAVEGRRDRLSTARLFLAACLWRRISLVQS